MANGNGRSREERYAEQQKQREQERKERAPTVTGSIKEGLKSAFSGGQADIARAKVEEEKSKKKREIDRQTGD